MKTERVANYCPKCHAPLLAEAPQGLCAKCLLAAAAAPTEAGQAPGDRCAPPPWEAIAAAFPQLEIVELIGQGGMGVVYKARQPKLDRFVALKILPPGLAADAAFAERFNREARVLARLNHPEIVTVYDFGEAGEFYYLLMEFVDGVNLRQAMQAGRFSPQQALVLVPKICEALQFAHNEGILHRDIKPENILLDTRGRVKIADFGIAKLLGEARENITLTGSGQVVGTLHYMAPEQLEHPQDVDQRADIYSLGVVFYEMLTGELPIGRFAPPSQKSAVDPRVDEVVLHALEKEREKRYHSAGEVKTRVEAITAHPGGPAAARPTAPVAIAPARSTTCYFSTPARMGRCFPSPQAHVFQCKGELRLETDHLTFISPWQTRVVVPFKEIRDLSVGEFQMATRPWAIKCERLYFLSITLGPVARPRRMLLTPVPPGALSLAGINAHVTDWHGAVRKAVAAVTGASPQVSDPAAVSIRGHRSWTRRVAPFVVMASVAACLLDMISIHSPFGPAPMAPWLAAVLLALLSCAALGWFSFGLLKADQALKSGNLDAVTSDEPPGDADDPARNLPPAESGAGKPIRPFLWTAAAWAFIAIGILAVIDTLTGLYSRPMNQTLSPAVAQLFAGIAMLTLSRRWRVVALVALGLALAAGVFMGVMLIISPEHGSVGVPTSDVRVPVTEMPRLAATAAVFLAVLLGGPLYLLLSARSRALFGLAKPK